MQQTPIKPPNVDMSREAVTRWLVIGFLVLVAFVALMFSRRLIQPMDNVLTQRECSTYGREVVSRESVDYEASNRFSLIDRTQGYCEFGPVVEFDEDGEVIEPELSEEAGAGADTAAAEGAAPADEPVATIQISLADMETTGFYRGTKWMFIALQIGAASAAVRIVADPLLDRFVRRPGR
jgi:hypothetical protein